ncbi:hypothetical protein [Cryobacterium sp. TMT2-10]|uniref:hypothetical protein n=1 Tax=Cryobacterium sp. TMT2-10 TaxID=1259244 RepID=UPI00141A8316|nr:hypothetical protein [Cryobacterium sp. TMT2-10]
MPLETLAPQADWDATAPRDTEGADHGDHPGTDHPGTDADSTDGTVTGAPFDLDGRRFYRITAYDQMPPFFMTLVGDSDVWLFISSTGGLTAGRVDAEHALFPYYTEDKITESVDRTGGLSVLRVRLPDGTMAHWQPFAELRPGDPAAARTLYKDSLGTTLVFEESRPDLALRLRVTWQTSARFGVVRSCALTFLSDDEPREVDLIDGLVNILPAGAGVKTQNELSVLLDAYKRSELDPGTGLGLLTLNATLTDLAEPSESLQANVAWQIGLGAEEHLLSVNQVPAFARGRGIAGETDVRGRRGAYLVHARMTLPAGAERRWQVVADVDQDAADVVGLRERLRDPDALAAELAADVVRTRSDLEGILAATDAAQHTGDELATIHHTANVLFNTMRGGVPAEGYTVEAHDVREFIAERSRASASRWAQVLAALPERLRADELIQVAEETGDVDLWRLCMEYLPLTFSRRHGDSSRPWNQFRIALTDESGARRLEYQGNWRDIFQNWEALAWSFPEYAEYAESMVTIFLDATTADGYNPYRISRAGIDWEVPEPEDPWSNIGYWSDHQIVYLLKLLETSRRFHPRAPRPARQPAGLHPCGRAVPDRAVCGHPHGPVQNHHLRSRAARPDPRAGRRRGRGRPARARRRRRPGAGHPGRETAAAPACEAGQPGARRRHLDDHPAPGVERRQQRPGGPGPVGRHPRLPPPLPGPPAGPPDRRRGAEQRTRRTADRGERRTPPAHGCPGRRVRPRTPPGRHGRLGR